jgi:hypothetical protein
MPPPSYDILQGHVEKYELTQSGAQTSHNCQAKGGTGMKTAMAVVLVAGLLCLAAGTSFATSGSASATASLTVEEIINVEVNWRSTGTPTKDFGTVPTGIGVNDYLDIDVGHNMDMFQTFSLGVGVDKNLGPDWAEYVSVYDGVDVLTWAQAEFGDVQTFGTAIGGSSQVFSESVEVTFFVGSAQTFGTFQFEVEVIVTSI